MMNFVAAKKAKLGKFETFDDDENEALRRALREYADKNKLSTTDLKPILFVSQQTAAGYLNGSGGFSRPAARQLCWLLGYEGIDDFLKSAGVFRSRPGVDLKLVKEPMTPQAFAATLARRVNVSELAMSRVNKRYEHESHHVERWWLDRYLQEQSAIDEEQLRRLEDVRKRPKNET